MTLTLSQKYRYVREIEHNAQSLHSLLVSIKSGSVTYSMRHTLFLLQEIQQYMKYFFK